MRDQKPRLRLKIACSAAIAAMLVLSGSAKAASTSPRPPPPKTYSCTCSCRQDSGKTVYIANKDFYSNVPCSSYSGRSCSVTVTTSNGTRTVSGRWESCVTH